MEMMYYQLSRSSYQDSLNILEVYADWRSKISTHGRKATIREFYSVLLPYLRWLNGCLRELDDDKEMRFTIESSSKKILGHIDLERQDECGICLEPCSRMVLPKFFHAMCIKCYPNWNTKSESCPFYRGSLKTVNSEDLWVLTCNDDVVDNETDDLLQFYLYINSLPKDYSAALFLVYYEYLI